MLKLFREERGCIHSIGGTISTSREGTFKHCQGVAGVSKVLAES